MTHTCSSALARVGGPPGLARCALASKPVCVSDLCPKGGALGLRRIDMTTSALASPLGREELGRGDDNTVGNPHRAQMSQFELVELILLLRLDKQFPVEQFEATIPQSTVPSPPSYYERLRSTVGSLIEFVWLKQKAYHGPQLTGICVKQQRGTLSSNSRCQTVLRQQYSANLST